MTKEDIKKSIKKLIMQNGELNNNEIFSLVKEYVKELKNITIDYSTFLALESIFSLRVMLQNCCDFFIIKFNVNILFDKNGKVINIY